MGFYIVTRGKKYCDYVVFCSAQNAERQNSRKRLRHKDLRRFSQGRHIVWYINSSFVYNAPYGGRDSLYSWLVVKTELSKR